MIMNGGSSEEDGRKLGIVLGLLLTEGTSDGWKLGLLLIDGASDDRAGAKI